MPLRASHWRARACVHGARDRLWWEFSLASSFQWEAHVWNLPAKPFHRRMQALVQSLGIADLLPCQVSELSPGQRALADLAVALAAKPRVLVWQEPFALMGAPERQAAIRTVLNLAGAEGLVVIAGPGEHRHLTQPETDGGEPHATQHANWPDGGRSRRHTGSAGRLVVAGAAGSGLVLVAPAARGHCRRCLAPIWPHRHG